MTCRVASGGLSRGPSPVPPVVMMRFTSFRSAVCLRAADSSPRSSERTIASTTIAPACLSNSTRALPEASSRSPRAQASLTVKTTARTSTDMCSQFTFWLVDVLLANSDPLLQVSRQQALAVQRHHQLLPLVTRQLSLRSRWLGRQPFRLLPNDGRHQQAEPLPAQT